MDYSLNNNYGVVGIINRGNYCYLSSVIQGLCGIQEFQTIYKDKSKKNFKGKSKGTIYLALRDVFKDIFSKKTEYSSPAELIDVAPLKKTIGNFDKSYAGLEQRDASEFLIFFLNTIHDELNEGVPNNNSANPPSSDESYWRSFKESNKSIITDLFYGLYKSSVCCLKCKYISNNYEPFISLELPLPKPSERKILLIFYNTQSIPVMIKFSLSEKIPLRNLRFALSMLFGVSRSCFLFAKIIRGELTDFLSEDFIIHNVEEQKEFIVCFQRNIFSLKCAVNPYSLNASYLEKLTLQEKKKFLFNLNIQLKEDFKDESFNEAEWFDSLITLYYYKNRIQQLFLFKRIIQIRKSWKLAELYEAMLEYFSHFLFSEATRLSRGDILKALEDFFNSNMPETFCYEIHKKLGLPFIMKFQPIFSSKTGKCVFCGTECKGCAVPYYNNYTIKDIINNQIIAELCSFNNEPKTIKDLNQVLYECLRIEVVFHEDYQTKLKKLLDYFDYNLSPTPSTYEFSLNSCFDLLLKKEALDENNKWKCDKCRVLENAERCISISYFPKILLITLKRFTNQISKDESLIRFPLSNFDVSNYSKNEKNLTYDLLGVINHSGQINMGHYYSYVKRNRSWYCFNDENVERIGEEKVVTKNAYLLIYRKV